MRTVTFTRSVQIFGPISIGILWEVRDVAVVAMVNEGTAMKSGLSTSLKSFFIIGPCYQV